MVNVTEYGEQLRQWQVGLAEWLGLDASAIFHLHDHPEPPEREWPYLDRGVTVTWKSLAQADPSRGAFTWGFESDGEIAVFLGTVALSPADWSEAIAAIGEKPRPMTREQELILKGLAYEDEHR